MNKNVWRCDFFFLPLIYFWLFVPFPWEIWEIWERFSQSIYKNGHLLSLCIWQVFFLCMILTADFLDGVQGRASSKRKIHFCESAFENQQKLWFSTQIHMSTVPFTEIVVDMKIHPLTIFISRFTACHYPNIYHQSHLSHSSISFISDHSFHQLWLWTKIHLHFWFSTKN